MKMVRSLLACATLAAVCFAGAPALAAPTAQSAVLYTQAPMHYDAVGNVFDANGGALILVASPAQQAQRDKFAACAHAWAQYKVDNGVSGKPAYNAYMSGCLRAPVPVPPQRPRRMRH